MKSRYAVPLVLLAVLLAAMPVFPGEEDGGQKDECLLIARNCGTSARSVQDKVERLQEEIEKGKRVYTPEELRQLKQKLDEVEKVLDFLGDQSPYLRDSR